MHKITNKGHSSASVAEWIPQLQEEEDRVNIHFRDFLSYDVTEHNATTHPPSQVIV